MTTPELGGELRNLIDARLDQIERVLLRVDVSYSERRHIVGEVESQVFELLARRSENPTRDDVQAVLDSLDPAEAYIPEELRGKFAEAAAGPQPIPKRPSSPRVSRLAVGSAAIAAGSFIVGGSMAAATHPRDRDEVIAFFGVCLLGTMACGLIACLRIVLSAGKLRGLPLALFATGLLPVVVINMALFALMVATRGLIPWLLATAGVIYLNYLGIRWFWRWLSSRQTQLAEMLRSLFLSVRAAQHEARAT